MTSGDKAPHQDFLLYSDPVFQGHKTGLHPENPKRLEAVLSGLRDSGLLDRAELGRVRPASPEEVLRVHSPDLLDFIEAYSSAGGGALDSDNVLSQGSHAAALAAAGSAVEAVEAVWKGPLSRAFCAVRPPGHHARPGNLMGFCLLNSAAIAARHAREVLGAKRVALLDIDVHHGNGSQEIFYADPSVHYTSLHRYPFWPPGSGSREETGQGQGMGANANFPLPANSSAQNYLKVLDLALEAQIAWKPDLFIVSAGFDTYRDDPVAPGGLNLEEEHYPQIGAKIRKAADEACGGRVVSLLEGGYNLKALQVLVPGFLQGLLG